MVATAVIGVMEGEGSGLEEAGGRVCTGEGVMVGGTGVDVTLAWAVSTAAIVWYTSVGLGVGVLRGRLLTEIRLITCHSKKLTPPATSSQTNTVSKLKRTWVACLADIALIIDSQKTHQQMSYLAGCSGLGSLAAGFGGQLQLPGVSDPGFDGTDDVTGLWRPYPHPL